MSSDGRTPRDSDGAAEATPHFYTPRPASEGEHGWAEYDPRRTADAPARIAATLREAFRPGDAIGIRLEAEYTKARGRRMALTVYRSLFVGPVPSGPDEDAWWAAVGRDVAAWAERASEGMAAEMAAHQAGPWHRSAEWLRARLAVSPPAAGPDTTNRLLAVKRRPPLTGLMPQHLADLRKSGLSDDTIRAARLYSTADPDEVARLLKLHHVKKAEPLGPCLVFPYYEADGERAAFCQVKADRPSVNEKGKPRKYQNPIGVSVRVYIPPATRAKLPDPAVPLVITEGIKKVLKADQEGFACLGLIGVDAWSAPRQKGAGGKKAGRRELHADFRGIPLVGRQVFITYDSDASTNPNVGQAEKQLRAALTGVGAKAKVIRLPQGPNGEKVGLDDFLHVHGPQALRQLFADPQPAGPPPAVGRVRVEVTPQQFRTNDAILDALPGLPDLYQRGDMLVRVTSRGETTKETVGKTVVERPAGPIIQAYDACTLGGDLTRIIDFCRVKETADGPEDTPAHPPGWAMNYVIKQKHWPRVPELLAVVTYPVIMSDGRVIAARGYDKESGVYLDGDFAGLSVPAAPTQRDAGEAAAVLADLVSEFPFESPAHLSGWVMATLTPLARSAYPGPTPLFLHEANTPAAGKTMLTDLTSEIVAGRPFPKCSYPTGDPREVEKLLTAFAVAGDTVFLFDNVAGRFGDQYLDKVLTGTMYQGRILGESRTWSGYFAPIVYATGNNYELAGDLSRRVVPVKLYTDLEFPDKRAGYKYKLPDHARENRLRYLSAGLTILRAYILAGRPPLDGTTPFGTFEGWAGLVRNAVVWAGLADISEARDQTRREGDRDRQSIVTLLAELRQRCPDGQPFTLGEVVKAAIKNEASEWATVAEALTALKATDTEKFGYLARRIKGRNFGNLRIVHHRPPGEEGKRTRGGVKWAVESCGDNTAAGGRGASSPSSHQPPGGVRFGEPNPDPAPHQTAPQNGRNSHREEDLDLPDGGRYGPPADPPDCFAGVPPGCDDGCDDLDILEREGITEFGGG